MDYTYWRLRILSGLHSELSAESHCAEEGRKKCPAGAILMVPSDPDMSDSPKIPVINTERSIGCGACENLCPSRPFSAIYVEGHEKHRMI